MASNRNSPKRIKTRRATIAALGGLLLLAASLIDSASGPSAVEGLATAGRIPFFLSNNPWILGVGAAITILVIVINSSRDPTSSSGARHSSAVPPSVSEVERLVEDARYARAMEILAEETREGGPDPIKAAVAHLTSHGIDPERAELNLVKIITVLQALHSSS